MNKEKSHPENDRLLLISEMAVEMLSGDGANPATCGHLKPGHRGGIGGWYLVE